MRVFAIALLFWAQAGFASSGKVSDAPPLSQTGVVGRFDGAVTSGGRVDYPGGAQGDYTPFYTDYAGRRIIGNFSFFDLGPLAGSEPYRDLFGTIETTVFTATGSNRRMIGSVPYDIVGSVHRFLVFDQPVGELTTHIEIMFNEQTGLGSGYAHDSFWIMHSTDFHFDIHHVSFYAVVPEPATWGLMVFGMGLIGTFLRRHKGNLRSSKILN